MTAKQRDRERPTQRVPLDLPHDLLRYTAEQFCDNADLTRLARCNRLTLRVLVDCRLSGLIAEVGLRLVEAAAARMAARRVASAAATAAMATDGIQLSSLHLPLPDGGIGECSTDSASRAHSSAAAVAAADSATEAAVESMVGEQSEAGSSSCEEASSRPVEASALDNDKPHAAPLSTSDMRVGRPVRMQTDRRASQLRPLAACSSLRTLRIEFDYDTLGLDSFWASTLSAALPPTVQELQIERSIWIRDSVDELQLPPSLTTLHLPFLRRFQSGTAMVDSPPLCPFPLARSLPSLTHLTLHWRSEWGAQPLPSSLLSLRIEWFRTTAGSSNAVPASSQWPLLPEGLCSLTLGPGVDQPMASSGIRLPSTLTLLNMSEARFNDPIESLHLPVGLRSLRLSHSFNQPVEQVSLPPALQSLQLGRDFNQPIEKLQLPASLTQLHLSLAFDHPCAGLRLPETLTELQFGLSFHSSLPLHLPDSIQSLDLGGKMDRYDERNAAEPPLRLPAAVTEFTLPPFFPKPLRSHLLFAPNSALTHLHLEAELRPGALVGVEWPASLLSLHLNCHRAPPNALAQVSWPPSLQQLRLRVGVRGEPLLSDWTPPPSLTHLCLSHMRDLDHIRWPSGMQRLSFEYSSLSDFSPSFSWPSPPPASLTALDLADDCDRVAQANNIAEVDVPPGLLPHGLRRLRLPPEWKGPLSQRLPLPATLTSLEIGSQKYASHFCGSLAELLRGLPSGLQSLALHHSQPLPSLRSGSSEQSNPPSSAPSSSPQPHLPPSLRLLRLRSQRLLKAEGWSALLDQRPDCSATFDY